MIDWLKKKLLNCVKCKNIQESKNQAINISLLNSVFHNEVKNTVKQDPAVQKTTDPEATQKTIEIQLTALVNLQLYKLYVNEMNGLLKSGHDIESEYFKKKFTRSVNFIRKVAYPEAFKNKKD